MESDPSDDSIPLDIQMIAVAINVRTKSVAVHRGTNSIEYPLTFEGVNDDDLVVSGEVNRLWFELHGWEWIVERSGSEGGDELELLVDRVADGSDVLDVMQDRVDAR